MTKPKFVEELARLAPYQWRGNGEKRERGGVGRDISHDFFALIEAILLAGFLRLNTNSVCDGQNLKLIILPELPRSVYVSLAKWSTVGGDILDV